MNGFQCVMQCERLGLCVAVCVAVNSYVPLWSVFTSAAHLNETLEHVHVHIHISHMYVCVYACTRDSVKVESTILIL